MFATHFHELLFSCVAGFSLLAIGVASLLTLKSRLPIRILACLTAGVTPAIGAGLIFDYTRLISQSAFSALTLACIMAIFGSRTLWVTVQKPLVRWGTVTVLGLFTMAFSFQRYNAAERMEQNQFEQELYDLDSYVPNGEPNAQFLRTDRGTGIEVKLPTNEADGSKTLRTEEKALSQYKASADIIRRGPADFHSNCHGWVFAAGQYWIGGKQVNQILEENGYKETATPAVGDLAIYRTNQGVQHTAIVRIASEGSSVLVESKWGSLGLYLHPVNRCPYGSDYVYYRSNRKGHVLAGAYPNADLTNAMKLLNP